MSETHQDQRSTALSGACAFKVEGLSLTIDDKVILQDVSLPFPKGELVGILGHNGSGKSTLMRIMARQQKQTGGRIEVFGNDLETFGERDFARRVAYLPQDIGAGSDMTVRELVACGRYPWHGALGRFSALDTEKVDAAITATHIDGLASRLVGTLSGGERQRVWIAMLIAQDSECLLLDEPTAALDIAHQIEILSLVRGLCHSNGLSVIVVLHDINMAARFCDHIHALKNGQVVASGTPASIVRPEQLKTIYGLEMGTLTAPDLDTPLAYVR
ncbi:iron(3+)-hydroxamate import ATP-binding protein FhuC [Brucella endophytica]|uniref:Iron(3+)-hydroxamate import ATP-binding protein FhuC n=1 Tax=Brucella endophytica TaxID=1963359 RepID=A0A916WI44_9HYPH|nr:ATP-binding cassette domain-containing protein [Brucella endophytica]GGA99591.1 iron(3+)-hydroxamate import ATP-binding protein FhuC [Brucella endophytica]